MNITILLSHERGGIGLVCQPEKNGDPRHNHQQRRNKRAEEIKNKAVTAARQKKDKTSNSGR